MDGELTNDGEMCQGHPGNAVAPGKKSCQTCLDRMKARRQQNSLNGMCRSHSNNPVVPGTTTCQDCFDYSKTYQKTYRKQRRLTDLDYKLRGNLRNRLGKALKAQLAGKSVSIKDLCCTIPELIKHLEAGFTAGMTWDNYGAWHIDHIRPLAGFDLTNTEQQKAAVHYTNLQPLWAEENFSKGCK